MIAIIDYGMGNLRSVQKGFEKTGHPSFITDNTHDILKADAVVLPGVGAFRDCMKNLNDRGLITTIKTFIESGKPFLGICLGLQLLFTESDEFGTYKGLDIIKGKVRRFPFYGSKGETQENQTNLKVPHMGWNRVSLKKKPPIMNGVEDGAYFYFVHSFYVEPEEPDTVFSTTDYGIEFVSGVWKENVYAMQFHPEKSQDSGLTILRRFGELI